MRKCPIWVFFLAELNDLLVCAGDVGNAFLTSYIIEPYYMVAGPEFGQELQGKCFFIYKSIVWPEIEHSMFS